MGFAAGPSSSWGCRVRVSAGSDVDVTCRELPNRPTSNSGTTPNRRRCRAGKFVEISSSSGLSRGSPAGCRQGVHISLLSSNRSSLRRPLVDPRDKPEDDGGWRVFRRALLVRNLTVSGDAIHHDPRSAGPAKPLAPFPAIVTVEVDRSGWIRPVKGRFPGGHAAGAKRECDGPTQAGGPYRSRPRDCRAERAVSPVRFVDRHDRRTGRESHWSATLREGEGSTDDP